MPIHQYAVFTFSELINNLQLPEEPCGDEVLIEILDDKLNENSAEPDGLEAMQGFWYDKLMNSKGDYDRISNIKVFMIGAGAIGCELLKNFAMLNVGVGPNGHIIVTDPDVIEVSNLNRQFLFREKHLRKSKSATAAAAAMQMNPKLKGKISAHLDKIHDETADIYNEEFYMAQEIVMNALDNV